MTNVEQCAKLLSYVQRSKSPSRSRGAYALKHVFERLLPSHYISETDFIKAAETAGFWTHVTAEGRVLFNMSARSVDYFAWLGERKDSTSIFRLE